MNRSVDIIVVTWNGREDTLRALECVQPQIASARAAGTDVQIVVVDNGSIDDTASDVLRRYPGARVLRLHRNLGFTGGVRAGVDASTADYVILLNNDAIPEPGWLESMVDSMSSASDDVAAVSGKIVDMTATKADFIGGILTFDGHAFQRDFRRPLDTVEEPAQGSELLFACGGNMIARRQLFTRLGGFDDDYFAYLEDVDFGWRAWLSGYRIVYDARGVIRHRSSATSDRLGSFERGVLFERNAAQTAIKNYGDASFREASGAIFLTMLHRLHHYAMTRNSGIASLLKPAFGDENPSMNDPSSAPSRLRRIRQSIGRAIAGDRNAAVLDDPLTAMQFRAIDWVFRNEKHLMEKRATVQRDRMRSDGEIFERFPIHYVPTYPGDRDLMSSALFRALEPALRSERKTLDEIMSR